MAKKTQIVCQHLENISRAALQEYQELIRQYIGRRHGIYALYRGNKLYYVGLANNLRVRLKQHLHDRHGSKWDRFSVYLTIDNQANKELESLVLRIANPGGNSAGGRLVRSENLARRLAQDVRSIQRQRHDDLLGRMRTSKVRPIIDTENGKPPELAQYVQNALKLRAKYRGKSFRAFVRKNGRVQYDGVVYDSPSKAAAVAVGRPSINGWWFWHYQRAPGDWVRLRTLRVK